MGKQINRKVRVQVKCLLNELADHCVNKLNVYYPASRVFTISSEFETCEDRVQMARTLRELARLV